MNPAEQTADAVTADYPGLRQSSPPNPGAPLTTVTLGNDSMAYYSWCGYEVQVHVGPADHLNRDDVEDQVLHRAIHAFATLTITAGLHEAPTRGHVEWDVPPTIPKAVFPSAHCVATADQSDPRFASAILATVAKALDYARITTAQAAAQAADAAEEVQWSREVPDGERPTKWLRAKRAERATLRAAAADSRPTVADSA